jgi:malate synthase
VCKTVAPERKIPSPPIWDVRSELDMATISTSAVGLGGFQVNRPPTAFDPQHDLPQGFLEFLAPLHRRFAPRQLALIEERKQILAESHQGEKPTHRFPGDAVRRGWRIELPEWCQDQRNQMTGPADDADLVVKMLNSGAPGVMLDLEDSMVNEWEHQRIGVENILQALRGTLTYLDKKRDRVVGIESAPGPGPTVIWIRPRGLHIQQAGVFGQELTSASLFDVARIVYRADPAELKHPLAFYIPKSESAEEALWWRDLFQALAEARGWPRHYIKCMALVESHSLAFEMEEFLYNLRDHILGLNLGRWDYMASLIDFNLDDPEWVLPDRNTIPSNVVFPEPARADAGNLPQARGTGDWRNDGAVSQPGRSRAEWAGAGGLGERQEERGGLPDGRRLDGASRSEPDRSRSVSFAQSIEGAAGTG